MKKRSKIIVSIVASVMCLGFFVFGVYAAIRATFGLSASFNFDAKGVYVGVSGQVYTGTSTAPSDLTALSGSDYKLSEQINFTPLTDGSGLPDESKSFSSIATWRPGNVSMDEDAPYLVYAVTFKNYSSKQICVTPTNSTAATAGVTMTENKNGLSSIASGSSKTYKLILQVTNVLIELNEKPISVSFTMQQTDEEPAPSSESYFLFDETTGQITGMNTETYTAATAPETLTIPATINGVEVKSLKAGTSSSSAFKLQSNTKNVIIKAAVDSIPEYCFNNCTSLISITLPEGVTSIGGWAVYGCTSLASITIPEGAKSIGPSTFFDCTSLTSLTIPSSVTSIGNGAFNGCSALMITVDEGNAIYSSLGGSLYDKDKKTLISGAGKAIVDDIPNGVTSIGEYAFYESTLLTSITIPSSVIHIGGSAFSNTPFLNNLGDENGLKIVASSDNANYKFLLDCGSNLKANITAEMLSGVYVIADFAFSNCRSLVSVIIPESVTNIGENTFWESKSLTSITIPSSVTNIDSQAFYQCTSLTSITIPSSVTSIGAEAFFGCTSLATVTIDGQDVVNMLTSSSGAGDMLSNSSLKTVYIKSGLDMTKATYLTSSFTKQSSSNKDGYDMWTR